MERQLWNLFSYNFILKSIKQYSIEMRDSAAHFEFTIGNSRQNVAKFLPRMYAFKAYNMKSTLPFE